MVVVLTNIPTPYRTHFFNELASEASKNGDVFYVLYCAITEPNRRWKFNSKENKYQYKILSGFHPRIAGIYPHINLEVISELKKLRPSKVLIAGSWNTPTMILALIYLNLKKVKTIFWSEAHSESVKRTGGVIALMRKIIFNLFSAFAVPNQRSEHYITNVLGIKNRPILFLPNTIDDEFFRNNKITLLDNKFELLKNKKIIIQVSQLEDRKGVIELVEGWIEIEKIVREGWMLVIAGDGNLHKTLIKIIKDRNNINDVFLTGQIDINEIKQLLHLSSIFILATKNDPNPLSVVEAAFSGLPLIVSSVAGNSTDLIIPGVNGLILSEISKEQISKAIINLIKLDPVGLKSMGQKSVEIAMKNFQSKKVVSNLLIQLNNMV